MVEELLSKISSILWGPPLLVLLVGTGLWFSFLTGFWQIRNLLRVFKFCLQHNKNDSVGQNQVTPYQAAATAMGGCIGSGNIGGVAGAIALGGPGVVFWMWVTALVGMMTKMVEVSLAVYYREKNYDGTFVGGPTYYMEKTLGKYGIPWKPLAAIFTFGILSQMVLTPENFNVSEALTDILGIDTMTASIFYTLAALIVICGGLKRVVNFATLAVPIMSFIYLFMGLVVIVSNYEKLPEVISLIFKHAFTPCAAIGGFAGATFMLSARSGIARGLFSNEAGWGTSPIVHATASNNHPIEQGMWGILEVFVDTIIVCSITSLVILLSGEWTTGAAGSTLTLRAFEHGLGRYAKYFVGFSLFIFCWTTTAGWSLYHQGLLKHIFKDNPRASRIAVNIQKATHPFYGLLITFLIVKFDVSTAYAWLIVDISSALPTFVNLLVILLLTGKFRAILKDYEGPRKLYGKEIYSSVDLDS